MKKDMWIVWVCLLGMVFLSGDIQADPPYGITLTHIKFNHDTSDDETDGVTIQKNKSDITAPEWVTSSQTNKAVAYVKSAVGKIILARFTCTSDTVTSAKIFATKTAGTYFADIGEKTITFSNGVSSPEYQQFTVTNVPTSVRKTTVTWQWKFKPVGSEQNITSTGPHTIYVILASPQAPMTKPWTEVLDYSCDWADGNTTASGAVSDLTEELYTCGVTYDGGTHYTSGSYTNLDLSSLLDDLANPSSVQMDCRDFSNFLHVLTNSLGVSGKYNRIDRTTSPYWFTYNYLLPANWLHWDTDDWNYHQVGWYYNSKVADAAAKIDNDADPTQGPGDQNHDPKLVSGDMGLSDYIDKLTETPDVDSVATGTCTVY